jgi:hypothetical protein
LPALFHISSQRFQLSKYFRVLGDKCIEEIGVLHGVAEGQTDTHAQGRQQASFHVDEHNDCGATHDAAEDALEARQAPGLHLAGGIGARHVGLRRKAVDDEEDVAHEEHGLGEVGSQRLIHPGHELQQCEDGGREKQLQLQVEVYSTITITARTLDTPAQSRGKIHQTHPPSSLTVAILLSLFSF